MKATLTWNGPSKPKTLIDHASVTRKWCCGEAARFLRLSLPKTQRALQNRHPWPIFDSIAPSLLASTAAVDDPPTCDCLSICKDLRLRLVRLVR